MIPEAGDFTHWLYIVAGVIFAISMVIAVVRLLMGPSLPDRVVALDTLGFHAVGVLCLYAIVTSEPSLLAAALVAALILFLGTAAFAIYVERRARS